MSDKEQAIEAITKMLLQAVHESKAKETPRDRSIDARVMLDMFEEVTKPCQFKAGDLVTLTQGRRISSRPDYGDILLVTHVFEKQNMEIAREDDSHTPRVDMTILMRISGAPDGGATWVEYAVESWRFERYQGPIEPR